MKTGKLYIVLVLSLLAITACTKKQDIPTGSVVWKISGNGLKQSSYVIGTHHLIPLHYLDSIPGIQEALDNTGRIVGEVVTQDMYDNINNMKKDVMMPKDTTYRDLLTEEDYNFLDEELKNWTAGRAGLEQMGILHPSVLSFLYLLSQYQEEFPEIDLSNYETMNAYLQRITSKNNKEVIGLETPEEEMNITFNSRFLKEQAEGLVCMVKNKEYFLRSQIEINEYYLKGDLENLSKLMDWESEPCPISEEYKFIIYKNRTNEWMKKLPSIIEEKPSLIAVSYLYITGKDGILYQLQQMGYKVTPVLK